jgi:dCTP deaminase
VLNCEEIARRLEMPSDDVRRISIVPVPDIAKIKQRGGTSIDLRLGRWFRSFKQSKSSHYSLWADDLAVGSGQQTQLKTNEHFVPFGEPFILHPGRFVLGVTMEWLTLPNSISGYVTGKSSLGRHGLVIETAAGLHPNFSGCLTLELANVGEVPVAISPGMEICQIFLHQVESGAGANPGTFSGQRKPAVSLGKPDQVFARLRGKSRETDPQNADKT